MNTRKLSKMGLFDQYQCLAKPAKLKVRDDFMRKAGFSMPAFYQKLRENSFRKLEKELLKELITKAMM